MNKEISRMLCGVADVDKFAETASQGNGNGWRGDSTLCRVKT